MSGQSTVTAAGRVVPDDLLAEMPDTKALLDTPTALRVRLREDGYVLIRGALDSVTG